MITPVNTITYQNQYSRNRITPPSFKGWYGGCNKAMKYVKGEVKWSRSNADKFDRLLADKQNFETMLRQNTDGIKDFVESNFENPFNCKILLNFPYDLDGKRIFENANIHKGLSSISYSSDESLGKLRRLFQYCADSLLLKENNFYANEGIREAIKKENIDYLSFLMNERMLLPYAKNGEIDTQTIILGRYSDNYDIRQFFNDNFLMHKARRHDYFSRGLYNEPLFQTHNITFENAMKIHEEFSRMTPSQQLDYIAYDGSVKPYKKLREDEEYYNKSHKFSKTEPKILDEPEVDIEKTKEFFKKVISTIRADEDKFGQVRLETLYKIATHKDFTNIKNASMNITGGKLQHLLAESYINPTDKQEIKIAKNIVEKLKESGANLDACDDLGETGLKRAVDAENVVVAKALLDNGANPHVCSNGADSAGKAAELSSNIDIFKLFEIYYLRS